MGSIVKIGWALLNRNRKLNGFIGFILMICLAGLIASLSIMFTTKGLFDRYTTEQKSAHLIRVMDSKDADIEAMRAYLDQDERIESYQLQCSVEAIVQINKYDDVMTIIEELPLEPKQDLIKVIEGEQTAQPGLNEVWIASGLAYRCKAEVGDTFQLTGIDGKENLKISGIVFDPLFASSMLQPSRVWVRSGQLSMIKGLGQDNSRALTIRVKDINQIRSVLVDFDKAFPEVTYGVNINHNDFKMMSNVLNDVMGATLLAVSLLLTIISAAIIFFIVSGEIINDYSVFGIYKGLGFSVGQIKNINRIKYILLVLMATPVSMLVALGISRLVLSIYEKMAGVTQLVPKLVLPTLISMLLVLFIIGLTIQVASAKLNRLKPAQAIRFGYESQKRYRKSTKPSKLNPVFSLGLKEVGLYPLRSGVKILTIAGLATLIFTLNIISSSMGNIFTSDLTMSMTKADLLIQKNDGLMGRSVEDIIKGLKATPGIAKVTPVIYSFNNAVIAEGERIGLLGIAYDDYTKDRNLNISEGKNPENVGETAITKALAQKINKNIGDIITLNIEGHNEAFTITGIFQIISNGGIAFRVTTEAYQKASPESEYSWFSVLSEPNEDLSVLKTKLIERFGNELSVKIFDEFVESTVGAISNACQLLFFVLVVTMSLICGLALYNMIWLQMLENKKYYGLMKAVGMSKAELTGIQLFGMILLTTTGVAIGLVISVFCVPFVLTSILSTTGISHFDTIQSPVWILGATLFIFVLTLLSTYMAAVSQSKVNLKSLIME